MKLRVLLIALSLLALAGDALASTPQMLVVIEKGAAHRVVSMKKNRPQIQSKDGTVRRAKTRTYALAKTNGFYPAILAVSPVILDPSDLPRPAAIGSFNVRVGPSAVNSYELTALVDIPHIYYAVIAQFDDGSTGIFAEELGSLRAGQTREVQMGLTTFEPGRMFTRLEYHFFCDGFEIPSTLQSSDNVQSWFDPLIRQEIDRLASAAADAPPRLFAAMPAVRTLEPPPFAPPADGEMITTPASYRPRLQAQPNTGTVTLAFRIDSFGRVQDATVVETTDDLLSSPALSMVKYWRYIPRLRSGKPVAAKVQIPIIFDSPPSTN